jgi:8-oxo-dGTP pyrophosphatase MutT (NUDIX family)
MRTLADEAFSLDGILRIASERLYTEPRLAPEEERSSDLAIAGLNPDAETLQAARPAAVLVGLVPRRDGLSVVFAERAGHLRQHSGQIAFPGGKIDPDDEGPLAAALREAEEEIGLAPDLVRPLGFLAPYFSSTGYRITPVIGLVNPAASLVANPDEVASIFEVPYAFLMNPAHHQLHEKEFRGQMRRYFAIPWQERYIWGVTAGILRMLWKRLHAPDDS